MYQFDISIHALARNATEGPSTTIAGHVAATLDVAATAHDRPLPVTFQQTAEVLESLDRMLFEADGSFVFSGGEGTTAWQVFGLLHDQGQRLLLVELRGTIARSQFDQLLAALGWPGQPLMFQLRQIGVFLSEQEFRQVAKAIQIEREARS